MPDWTGANCAGVDQAVFFPPGKGTIDHDVRMVRQICIACNLYRQCLGYSVKEGEPYGIWAGYGPAGLRMVRRKTGNVPGLTRDQALDDLVASHQTVLTIARRVPVRELRPGDLTLDRNGDSLEVELIDVDDDQVKILWVGQSIRSKPAPRWVVSLPGDVMLLRRLRRSER